MIDFEKGVFFAAIESAVKELNRRPEPNYELACLSAQKRALQGGLIPAEETKGLPCDFAQHLATLAPLYQKQVLTGVETFEVYRVLDLVWLEYSRLLAQHKARGNPVVSTASLSLQH
ncbi:hypothetical protein HYW59_04265 [Candidatus Kaiserbacteria bacterium]|nr:hypothetical protein [Candidatus Kaiserbacteria bacterium]